MKALRDKLREVRAGLTTTASGAIGSAFTPRWQALSPTGQRVISAVSALLMVGVVWALVYEPIQQSREKDRARITTLQTQLRHMQAQANEVQQLRTMAPVAATASLLLADVVQLQTVFGPQASVSLAANTKGAEQPVSMAFRISISQMPYATLVERLEQTSARFRLRVVSAALSRTPGVTPATVSGDIFFADAR